MKHYNNPCEEYADFKINEGSISNGMRDHNYITLRIMENVQKLMPKTFAEMYADLELLSKKIEYASFGVCDFYSPSLVEDIIIGGNKRGRLLKRMTAATHSYHEYHFDKNGKMLCSQTFIKNKVDYKYIVLYKDDRTIYRVFWDISSDSLYKVEECIFDDYGYIKCFTVVEFCDVIRREWFGYSKDKLWVYEWNGVFARGLTDDMRIGFDKIPNTSFIDDLFKSLIENPKISNKLDVNAIKLSKEGLYSDKKETKYCFDIVDGKLADYEVIGQFRGEEAHDKGTAKKLNRLVIPYLFN